MVAEPRGVSWKDLPDDLRAELQKQSRRRQKLRRMGRPSMVDSGPAMRYVRRLHDEGGLTFQQMADQCELSQSTFSDLYRGHRGRSGNQAPINLIPRRTEHQISTVPMPAVADAQSRALVDATATRRRLRALQAAGFTTHFLGEYLGHNDWNAVWRLMAGKPTKHHHGISVEVATMVKVKEAYDKLIYGSPEDYGISQIGVSRARNTARRHGYVPHWAWDDDTIADPAAAPEWTGACGSEEGYRIHLRETLFEGRHLPLCDRCRRAVELRQNTAGHTFHPERLRELMAEHHISARRLAKEVGIPLDSLYNWVNGANTPRRLVNIQAIANHFGVGLGELLTFAADEDISEMPLVEGGFNRFVLMIALDIREVSRKDAATVADVSHKTMNNWVSGRRAPENPAKLDSLARYLGVKPEVFYT